MAKKKGRPVETGRGAAPAYAAESVASTPTHHPGEGLFKFYSSQAKAMLAQYRNINHLLGPTRDWTGPGTLCEVLIRDLIRRVLPSRYSVDKGFMFGRRMNDDEEVHSPEIDVLGHDTHDYVPVYRVEDFVIVDPASVRAVIQVKRTLKGDKLKKAIDNFVGAKQHLKAFDVNRVPNKDEDIFSAALFFGDGLTQKKGGISSTYRSTISGSLTKIDKLIRPHFLGSLENRFYVVPFGQKDRYEGYPSRTKGSVALVMFLAYLTQYILPSDARPTFYRPTDVRSDETIQLGASSAVK